MLLKIKITVYKFTNNALLMEGKFNMITLNNPEFNAVVLDVVSISGKKGKGY